MEGEGSPGHKSMMCMQGEGSPDHRKIICMLEQVLESVKSCQETVETQQSKMLKVLEATFDVDEQSGSLLIESHQVGESNQSETADNCNSMPSRTFSSEKSLGGTSHKSSEKDIAPVPSRKRNTLTYDIVQNLTRVKTIPRFSDFYKWTVLLPHLRMLVQHPRFDFVMGAVIVVNSVYIGFQIEASIQSGPDEAAPLIEYLFLAVYASELALRFWALGVQTTLHNGWNLMDCVLVALGSISLLIIEPINQHANLGRGADFLKQITLLRLLRLLRLVRSLRLLRQFKILWNLVNGLLHALPTIVSTLTLLCLLIYIFACGGVELITKNEFMKSVADNDPSIRSIIDSHFSTLPMVALTLIRFTTMDSIGVIYEPLVREKPSLIVYFVLLLLVISITIMNLITAVLVEHSITMAKHDTELEMHLQRALIKQLIPKIEELFRKLDTDEDGFVSLQEALHTEVELPKELSELIPSDTIAEVFDELDADESGSVDKEEFVHGIVNLAVSDMPIETRMLLIYGRSQSKRSKGIEKQLDELVEALQSGIVPKDVKAMFAWMLSTCVASNLGARHGDDEVLARVAAEKRVTTVPSMRLHATTPRRTDLLRTPRPDCQMQATPSHRPDMLRTPRSADWQTPRALYGGTPRTPHEYTAQAYTNGAANGITMSARKPETQIGKSLVPSESDTQSLL